MEELTIRFIESYEWLKTIGLVTNDTDLAAKLQVSRASITEILKGRNNPGGKILQNYVTVFPVNGTWLLTNIGEMDRRDKTYADTPQPKNHLNDRNEVVYTYTPPANAMGKSNNLTTHAPPTAPATPLLYPQIVTVDRNGKDNIVHVPVRARAGYLTGYGDPEFIETLPSFSLPGLTNSTYRSFEVDGDSMYPTLKSKQMVIGEWVENLDHIRDDRVYILVTKTEGVIIKRLLNRIEKHGFIVAKSDAIDNRNLYQNITVKPEDIQEIWYAVWHGGFDFQSPSDTWRRINNHEADITMLQNQVSQLLDVIKTAGLLKQNGK